MHVGGIFVTIEDMISRALYVEKPGKCVENLLILWRKFRIVRKVAGKRWKTSEETVDKAVRNVENLVQRRMKEHDRT